MFTHVMVGSNDISRSRIFYDALFNAMGGNPAVENAQGRLVYLHDGGRFVVTKPIDGGPATYANGGTIRFCGGSTQQRLLDRGHRTGWPASNDGALRH
jgi:hypothetical protein